MACVALSGFHSSSPPAPRPKLIEEGVAGCGYDRATEAMLMESFVAVMRWIAASVLDPGLVLRHERAPGRSLPVWSRPRKAGGEPRLHHLAGGADRGRPRRSRRALSDGLGPGVCAGRWPVRHVADSSPHSQSGGEGHEGVLVPLSRSMFV
ncbi:carbon starvation CstA family protein [Streptomyces clavuligerus]|uniref:carbon starvation CstA family protein n=1 Tax=Streptomyces clavuligerus TaxID=1901 RepID=UPI0023DD8CDA|nr:carbon starvation CstA family protein [Streptomyces clavuligerus]